MIIVSFTMIHHRLRDISFGEHKELFAIRLGRVKKGVAEEGEIYCKHCGLLMTTIRFCVKRVIDNNR